MSHQELERIKEILASVREQQRILTELQARLQREIDYATALLKALTPAVAVSATLSIEPL
jgi:hypothetical protein